MLRKGEKKNLKPCNMSRADKTLYFQQCNNHPSMMGMSCPNVTEEAINACWDAKTREESLLGYWKNVRETAARGHRIAMNRGEYDNSEATKELRSIGKPPVSSFMWVTINPRPDTTIIHFQKCIFGFIKAKFITNAIYSFEQGGKSQGELGVHPHCHILMKQTCKYPSDFQRYCRTHFGQIIDCSNALTWHRWIKYMPHKCKDTSKRVNYLMGDKRSQLKCNMSKLDKLWRQKHDIEDIYTKMWVSDLGVTGACGPRPQGPSNKGGVDGPTYEFSESEHTHSEILSSDSDDFYD